MVKFQREIDSRNKSIRTNNDKLKGVNKNLDKEYNQNNKKNKKQKGKK